MHYSVRGYSKVSEVEHSGASALRALLLSNDCSEAHKGSRDVDNGADATATADQQRTSL